MRPKPPSPQQQMAFRQAVSFHQAGNIRQANALLKQLLAQQPDNPDVLKLLGTTECQLGNLEQGVSLLGKSLKIFPNQPMAHNNRGNALASLGRLEEAVKSYNSALALKPDYAEAYHNRGNALRDLGRIEAALASYDQALALNPNHVDACINKAIALRDDNQLKEAGASLDKALALNPNAIEAYWNKSLLLILQGEYAEGWRLYESRWRRRSGEPPRDFREPRWSGEDDIAGKTLLIYSEQGYGDVIQFSRYALLARDLGAKVILEVPPPLLSIMASLGEDFTLVQRGQALPPFDYQCAVMSLPLAFKTEVATIPAATPYLFADAGKISRWQEKLGARDKPRIGLAWSGSSTHKNDRNRSIPLASLEPLLNLPLEFHALQKEIRQGDLETLARFKNVRTHQDSLGDFSDTAALAEAMDVVISVDTAVAHLAGAMGKEVWILLPFMPDYRWLLHRSDTPWYPTARLFRQPASNDWATVAAAVAAELDKRRGGPEA